MPGQQAKVGILAVFRLRLPGGHDKGTMELKLYDTLTREKRVFAPIDPARVRMYVCGPTVYDFAHIGNARPVIVFDVLYRLLRHLYGAEHVTYVRNITDVDDKINARAAERGISIRELTETTYRNFKEDVAALGALPPTVEPRATDHIEEMKALIERLVQSGHAYAAEEHVLFSVPSMPDYGALSKRPLKEMIAGARVEVAPYKRDPMDFVLWKPSKEGEPAWPSPAGVTTPGRPGWHIECSAMADKWLWTEAKSKLTESGLAHPHQFDIHGGGIDLVFPHHENEIAQSRCAFHTGVMANTWMHNGFLQVEGEKMAKSAGNFVTIRELLADWPGEVLRLAMLQTHYRQPINWTYAGLQEAQRTLDSWYKLIGFAEDNHKPDDRFVDALCDDLNTPLAISRLHQLAKPASVVGSVPLHASRDPIVDASELKSSGQIIGLFQSSAADWVARKVEAAQIDVSKVTALIEQRETARKAKNFAESDRIRDELAAMGVVLKDSKEGTTWEIAR
jgi:cysteinyl-tRNA synthetase